MKSMMKDAAILFAITLIAGLLLGVVYEVTKEPIEIQQAKKRNEAFKEVFQDDIEFAAVGKGKARLLQQLHGLRKRKLQRDGEGEHRGLAGLVGGVGADLAEQLPVHVGLFVALRVGHAFFVDQAQQGGGEALVGLL